METDYNSIKGVCTIMEHTGLTKFLVFRYGDAKRNTTPVFEHTKENCSSTKAVEAFKKWAAAVENSNAYEMWLFEDYKDVQAESKREYTIKTGLMRFTFCLKPDGAQIQGTQAQQNLTQEDLITNIINRLEEKRKADTTNQRFEALNEKLDAYINGTDDEEEEEPENKSNQLISQLITLAAAFGLTPKATPALALNGVSEAQQANINKAIEILSKNDPNIDTDLLKLASLSEGNPVLFNGVLNSLRNLKV